MRGLSVFEVKPRVRWETTKGRLPTLPRRWSLSPNMWGISMPEVAPRVLWETMKGRLPVQLVRSRDPVPAHPPPLPAPQRPLTPGRPPAPRNRPIDPDHPGVKMLRAPPFC